MSTYVNSFKPAGGVAAGAYALGFTPSVGNTLLVVCHLTAGGNTLSTANMGSGRNFTTLYSGADPVSGENLYLLSRVIQAGDGSNFIFTTSAGNLFFYAIEVSGIVTPEASGFESYVLKASSSSATFSAPFTTANSNDFVLTFIRYSGTITTITGLSSGYTRLANGRAGSDVFYSNDVGPAGSQTFGFTNNTTITSDVYTFAFKSSVSDPTVTTVTGSTVTEGTANRFTVSLSAATNRTTTYPVSFGGTAVAGTDYDGNLANATFSTGASFVGGQLQLLSGYSSATIDVPTVDNALDQFDRTLILTVGGVASTGGNILDNDPLPAYTISNPRENGNVVNFDLSIPVASGRDITFFMSTSEVTGSMISAGVDYMARTSITVVIPKGQTSVTVTVNRLP